MTLYTPSASAGVIVLFANVHVPLPLFVAGNVIPFTTTTMVAVVSDTVPLIAGVVSLVAIVVAVMVGTAVKILSSFVVASAAVFPSVSAAEAVTLYVASAKAGFIVLSARVQVPLPLFTAARLIWPPTATVTVAAMSLMVPVNWGRLSAVVRVLTVTVGAVVSIRSSAVVLSVPVLFWMSVAVAWTS